MPTAWRGHGTRRGSKQDSVRLIFAHHLATGTGAERGERRQRHRITDELNVTVAEQHVGAAGVEAAGTYTAEGDPAKTINSLAESAGADLIVIGRGTARADTGRLGDNAYAMIRQSRCPVVSV